MKRRNRATRRRKMRGGASAEGNDKKHPPTAEFFKRLEKLAKKGFNGNNNNNGSSPAANDAHGVNSSTETSVNSSDSQLAAAAAATNNRSSAVQYDSPQGNETEVNANKLAAAATDPPVAPPLPDIEQLKTELADAKKQLQQTAEAAEAAAAEKAAAEAKLKAAEDAKAAVQAALDDLKQEMTGQVGEKDQALKVAKLEIQSSDADIQELLKNMLNSLKKTLVDAKNQSSKEVGAFIQEKIGEIEGVLTTEPLDMDGVLKQVNKINNEVDKKREKDSVLTEKKIKDIYEQLITTYRKIASSNPIESTPGASVTPSSGGRKSRNNKKKKKSKAKKNITRRRRRSKA